MKFVRVHQAYWQCFNICGKNRYGWATQDTDLIPDTSCHAHIMIEERDEARRLRSRAVIARDPQTSLGVVGDEADCPDSECLYQIQPKLLDLNKN